MGAQGISEATTNYSSLQRVKVYRMNNDGKWDDQGTGRICLDQTEKSEDLNLLVMDEEDNETLLLHRICSDDIYRKQEDTIISWKDPEYSTDLALSFQEITGCSFVWDHISLVQRNLHFNTLNNETFQTDNDGFRELPVVELSSLSRILKIIVDSGIGDQMRLAELILNNQHFFRKLMDLFHICEDQGNFDGLHMIFKIVKGIVLLNSLQIYDKIFEDELMMDVIGSFEYDPDISQKHHHRKFLKEHIVFKEAIPIKDPDVLSKIHQTYRVRYLKDVILPRLLDDAVVANLNFIIHTNNAIVVTLLKDDSSFIKELFAKLKSPTTSTESKTNLIYFLHEFCCTSKSLQVLQQHRLFRDLGNEGIFNIITDALRSQDKQLVLTGTDILILFMNQDPNLLRSYIIQPDGIPLLGLLVKGMIADFGADMNCQFLEILRSLLDSYTLLPGSQRDVIVETFYENHFGQLIDVIASSCRPEGIYESINQSSIHQNGAKPEILSNICELLCFCVLHYPATMKRRFLLHNVIGRVLLLTRRREKYLVVAAVRFVRIILSQHDEHLVKEFVRNNHLKAIVDAFVDNGNRYNLLNSAVLELFEYIRKENLPLLRYIVDSFWDRLLSFESLATIQSLKLKYDQSLESVEEKGAAAEGTESRKRNDERAVEKEEEDYFNAADSDEEDGSCRSKKAAAVPNGHSRNLSPTSWSAEKDEADDADDAEYRPPPRKERERCEGEGLVGGLKRKGDAGELMRRQPHQRRLKSRDSVFAALCSTLSQAVLPPLPAKKINGGASEGGKEGGLSNRSCSDCVQKSVSELNGEDCGGLVTAPNSSSKMTVNGS